MVLMGRSKKMNDDGMELSILQKEDTKLKVEEMEYEYKDFKWKDPFTKAKYIRLWPSTTDLGAYTDRNSMVDNWDYSHAGCCLYNDQTRQDCRGILSFLCYHWASRANRASDFETIFCENKGRTWRFYYSSDYLDRYLLSTFVRP